MVRFILFVYIILLIISCSTANNKFGQMVIDNATDTTILKQTILKIRSIENTIFDSATFLGKEQIAINYCLYKPKQAKTNKKYPLVVVFHGSGAIGVDNKSQLGIIQKLFASPDIQKKYPAYVLAPQFSTRSSDYVMDTKRNVLTSVSGTCLSVALQLVDSLLQNMDIDAKRIYVVGFSMGGSTAINSLSIRPDLFAAGISISGIPQFDKIEELNKMPIWLIHGMDDTENPINSDEKFFEELSRSNKIRFWKLRATTHDNVFTTKILGETMPKWLFKQIKK